MVFRSPYPDLDIPKENICDFMFPEGKTPSDKPLWIDADDPSHSLSPHAALRWIRRLGYGLKKLGIKKGDVCMIFTPNHIYVPVAYLGFVGYGAAFSGSNPSYTVNEMVYQMVNTSCQLMFVHPVLLSTALAAAKKAGLDKGRMFLFTDKFEDPIDGVEDWRTMLGTEREGANWQWQKLRPKEAMTQTATVNFSSGTTGLSKGVCISHSNVVANAEQMRIAMSLKSSASERWVGFLPLYHAYGQAMMILMATRLHIPVYVMRRFDLLQFLYIIQTYSITKLQVVPPIMVMLDKRPEVHSYDLSSVKLILCGAAPMSRELQDTISKRFDLMVMQAWGMTELVNCGLSNSPTGKNLGVGQLIPNTECKLIDDEGNEVTGAGARGEIYIRGPQVALRYWRNEEATRESFDSEGWFKTGDVAVVNEEGYFWLVDRKKELIKVNGLQVSPAELEACLLESEHVADCGVVGITVYGQELPRAYIKLAGEAVGKVVEGDIMRYMDGKVASFKQLKGGIVFVEEIPRLASGKIMRKEIRAWAKRDGMYLENKGGFRARL